MDTLSMGPILWAQTGPDQSEMPILALRRWVSSLTLSAPEATPSTNGLWIWLAGLGTLFVLAIVAQGPLRALVQLVDLPGHVRLAGAAIERLRAAGRLVVVTLGATVLAWTAYQFVSYNNPDGLNSLQLLVRSKSTLELATEQGILAGLTPMRDVFGLGDLILLVIAATLVIFRFSADRWGAFDEPESKPAPGWATLCWGGTGVYALYRMTSVLFPTGDLPLGGCLFLEALLVPGLMVVADAVLLAWVLLEIRRDNRAGDIEGLDVRGTLLLVPGAVLACLVALPARYVATGAYLALPYVPDTIGKLTLVPLLSGWGLAGLQGAALVLVGLVGVVPWIRNSWRSILAGYLRLLRAEGGRLVAVLGLGGLAAGLVSGIAYLLILALPPQPWVLTAADAYAHYGTLAVGLATLAALVELGGRALANATAEPGGLGASSAPGQHPEVAQPAPPSA